MNQALLKDLAVLRLLVVHLGETVEPAWWTTSFTSAEGLEVCRQTFPRSWVSAAVGGASRAACEVHDTRIGRNRASHLFRFGGGLERQLHRELLQADQDELAGLLESKDSVLEHLKALNRSGESEPGTKGPVEVKRSKNAFGETELSSIARAYYEGFLRNEPVFPYFSENDD